MRIPYKKIIGQDIKPGRPSIGKKPEKPELKKFYIKEARSIREIAEILGCSKDLVYRSLKEYGIERRERLHKSKLNKYSFDFLEGEVKNKGFKQTALDLEVNVHTLRVHFNRRKNKKSHSVA